MLEMRRDQERLTRRFCVGMVTSVQQVRSILDPAAVDASSTDDRALREVASMPRPYTVSGGSRRQRYQCAD
jgi:hypothetical protein